MSKTIQEFRIRNLFKPNTYKTGFVWTVGLNVAARGLNFLLGVLLARSFAPASTDVYLFVWSVIGLVLICTSTINLLAASPGYIKLKETGKIHEAAMLNNALLNVYIFPLLLISVVIFFFPYFVFSNTTGFDYKQLLACETMLRLSGLWLILFIVNNFLGNILLSNKFFAASLIGQVIIGLIAVLFFVVLKKEYGASAFFWGHMAGNIVALVFQVAVIRKHIPFKFSPFYFRFPPAVVKEVLTVLSTTVPTMISNFMVVYFLSKMGEGSVSSYNYANNLSNLPDVILLSQITSIAGIKMSEISVTFDNTLLFNTYSFLCRHMFFLMSGIAVVVIVAGPDIISIIYGHKMEPHVFDLSVLALSILVIALPVKSLDIMNNRLFASLQGLSKILKYSFPIKIIGIILLFGLASFLGFTGVMLYFVIMPVTFVVLYFSQLKTRFQIDLLRKHITQMCTLFACAITVYMLCWLISKYFFTETPPMLRIILFSLIVLFFSFLIERILGLTQFMTIIQKNFISQLRQNKLSSNG